MPGAGQIYDYDATDVDRARLQRLARDLDMAPDVLPPPNRSGPPMSCRLPDGYHQRLDALSGRLKVLPGATRRMAVALGVDMLERAITGEY